MDEPRCHHYTFVHQALPTMAFDNPLAFLSILASSDAREFLAGLIRGVSEHCKAEESQPGFGVEDIIIHKVRVGKCPCAVIEMPEPRE